MRSSLATGEGGFILTSNPGLHKAVETFTRLDHLRGNAAAVNFKRPRRLPPSALPGYPGWMSRYASVLLTLASFWRRHAAPRWLSHATSLGESLTTTAWSCWPAVIRRQPLPPLLLPGCPRLCAMGIPAAAPSSAPRRLRRAMPACRQPRPPRSPPAGPPRPDQAAGRVHGRARPCHRRQPRRHPMIRDFTATGIVSCIATRSCSSSI